MSEPLPSALAQALFRDGLLPNVRTLHVEPRYGHIAVLTYVNGTIRVLRRSDVGLNSSSASNVAKDKDFAKHFLRAAGLSVPEGFSFILPWWRKIISNESSSTVGVAETVGRTIQSNRHLEYPVFIKPVDGSMGMGIHKCWDECELLGIVESFERERVKVGLVEESILLPDFRLVMLDGELISSYQRVPLRVVGDGASTIGSLLVGRQRDYWTNGRDTRINLGGPIIEESLRHAGLSLESIPANGEEVQVREVSNLSAGGTSIDVTARVAEKWVSVAREAAGVLGLRLCGVDLMCADITAPSEGYFIIEINASPGLDHYAATGVEQRRLVEALYQRVLNVMGPASA